MAGCRIEREKIWYRNRIQKQCKRGNEEEALTLFEEMKTNRIYPEVVMFNNLIAALGRKGKVKEAFKLFNDVSSPLQICYICRTQCTCVCMGGGVHIIPTIPLIDTAGDVMV